MIFNRGLKFRCKIHVFLRRCNHQVPSVSQYSTLLATTAESVCSFHAKISKTREPLFLHFEGMASLFKLIILKKCHKVTTRRSWNRHVTSEYHCLCASLRCSLAHSGLYMGWLAWSIETELPWSGCWVQRLSVILNVRFVLCCIAGCFICCCLLVAELSEKTDRPGSEFVSGRGSKIAWDLRSDWSLVETSCTPAHLGLHGRPQLLIACSKISFMYHAFSDHRA